MELLKCKTRLAVLWIINSIGFSVFLFLSFMESGTIEGIMSGNFFGSKVSEGVKLWFGLYWWIPWIMAWLSLTLKGSANRWTNFILGIIFAIDLIFGTIMNASKCSPAMLVDYILGILVSALIAWYAWNLPKQEA